MNYEEKINELEDRIEYLEKKEKRRTIAKWISIGIKLAIAVVVIIMGIKLYGKLIKYKKQLDELTNIEEKLDGAEDWFNSLKKYDLFNFDI